MKKEIVLIRHAKVKISSEQRSSSSELKHWVKKYDMAELEESSVPNAEVHEVVNSADFLMTSMLFRTIASASKFEKKIDERNELFNEAGLPNVHIPWFKFKAKTWLVILRLLLFTGRGKGDDSFKASNTRAKKASDYLCELSKEHNKVVLVGHGGMNFFMSRILRKQGWKLDGKASSKNWGMTKLYKEA
jgi:phosphohistidine phosphatase SixA